jgi:hypothetical protein
MEKTLGSVNSTAMEQAFLMTWPAAGRFPGQGEDFRQAVCPQKIMRRVALVNEVSGFERVHRAPEPDEIPQNSAS